jgi:hypothetical protein
MPSFLPKPNPQFSIQNNQKLSEKTIIFEEIFPQNQ